MNRVRVYNEKGAKFTTTSDKAIENNWILVEVKELLERKKILERKISITSGMEASLQYYNKKLCFCQNQLGELRKQHYYVPSDLDDLNPNILN